ncbi:MAG: YbeD family protein [Planctomycetaceae bacterium]
MRHLPTVELLNSTHDFPCPYVFKVIGRTEQGFAARVVAAVREELGEYFDPPHRTRLTAGGRHVAVTIEPMVETAEQVQSVYRRLVQLAGLVMMF